MDRDWVSMVNEHDNGSQVSLENDIGEKISVERSIKEKVYKEAEDKKYRTWLDREGNQHVRVI